MSTSKTDYTLPILTVVLSLLFLLISVRSSSTVENTAELYVLIAGRFIVYELFLFLSLYRKSNDCGHLAQYLDERVQNT